MLAHSLLLAALAAEPAALTYLVPRSGSLAEFRFTQWNPGAQLFAADDLELKERADASGKAVARLGMGTAVAVREMAPAPARLGDRVNKWYRVESAQTRESGWVFGADLTPFRFDQDFDGDGEVEIATVSQGPGLTARVRFLEPGLSIAPRVASADARAAGWAQGGGELRAQPLSAAQAGVSLVEVDAEGDREYGSAFVSYQVPGNAQRTLGRAQVALAPSAASDAQVERSFNVEFASAAKTAAVIHTSVQFDPGSGDETRCTKTESYRFESGVFRKEAPARLAPSPGSAPPSAPPLPQHGQKAKR